MKIQLSPAGTDILGLGEGVQKIQEEHTGKTFGYIASKNGEYVVYLGRPLPLKTLQAVVHGLSELNLRPVANPERGRTGSLPP